MLFGNRGARSSGTKQRKSEAFQPRGEALEQKVLLTLLKLGAGTPLNIAGRMTTAPAGPQTIGGQLPFIADSSGLTQVQGTMTTDLGLGVLETNNVASQGAGYSVAGLGDMNLDGSNDYLIGAPGVMTQSSGIISPPAPPTATPATSQAFLIFGNRTAPLGVIQNWSSNPPTTPEQRVGVLAN
ncbi:MAG TPA: integrin alpha, partial [Candidatus Methylomirabilis sp.]|nr:integrin alpha [Candidatus Methylomirabilis sp.]